MPVAVCAHAVAASPCVVLGRGTPATVVLAEVGKKLAHIVHILPTVFELNAGLHHA